MKNHRILRFVFSLLVTASLLLSTVSSAPASWGPGTYHMVKDINPVSTYREGDAYVYNGAWFKDQLIFSADDSIHNDELWSTTGTEESTHMIKDIYPGYIGVVLYESIIYNDWLLFSANDGKHGQELWRTDGTEAGTQMVGDLAPGFEWSDPVALTPYKDEVYFISRDSGIDIPSLWKTNGEAAGTQMIITFPSEGIFNGNLTRFKDLLYFFLRPKGWTQLQLWRSDGTAEGTYQVAAHDTTASSVTTMDATNAYLYYYRIAPDHSVELWQTGGEAESTKKVMTAASSYEAFDVDWTDRAEAIGDTVYFVAQDETGDYALWKIKDTDAAAGPVKIHSFGPQADVADQPTSLSHLGDDLYFCSADHEDYTKVWRSDGTTEGTYPLVPPHDMYVGCYRMEQRGDQLFFVAFSKGQYDLWTSDGTARGTWRMTYGSIKDPYLPPIVVAYVDNRVFFTAKDSTHGRELWVYAFNKAYDYYIPQITGQPE